MTSVAIKNIPRIPYQTIVARGPTPAHVEMHCDAEGIEYGRIEDCEPTQEQYMDQQRGLEQAGQLRLIHD